ncbi:Endopolyphosphatase [Smittium mucronatum]|uniref:Endopolyphosphatase n=1 Tax=Smittium mucronatum TaxID=133383 RepID=A0A1R0H6C5_9FUNG|nr:Endopolyphosphatase [Smittium mucronatum]
MPKSENPTEHGLFTQHALDDPPQNKRLIRIPFYFNSLFTRTGLLLAIPIFSSIFLFFIFIYCQHGPSAFNIWGLRFGSSISHEINSSPPKDLVASQGSGKFLHITDFHYDMIYSSGSLVENFCHEDPDDILFNSSSHKKHRALENGTPYSLCDSPSSLLNITSEFIVNNILDDLDFVVLTGDNSRHDRDSNNPFSKELVIKNQRHMFKYLRDTFDRQSTDSTSFKRVIPLFSLGNNDVYPRNMISSTGKKSRSRAYLELFYELLSGDPSLNQTRWIDESQKDIFLKGGYYSKNIPNTNFKVISLNTLYFFVKNKYVGGCKSSKSPGLAQLGWLRSELKSAVKEKKAVIIIGHIMPHSDYYKKSCLKEYRRTISKFSKIIKSQLFGHINRDIFYFISPIDYVSGTGNSTTTRIVDLTTETLEWERRVDRGDFWWLNEDLIDEEIDDTDDLTKSRAKSTVSNAPATNSLASSEVGLSNSANRVKMNSPEYYDDIVEGLFDLFEEIVESDVNENTLSIVSVSHSVVPVFLPGFKLIKYQNLDSQLDTPLPPKPTFFKSMITGLFKYLYQLFSFSTLNKDISFDAQTCKDKEGSDILNCQTRNSSPNSLQYGDILDYSVYCLNLTAFPDFKKDSYPMNPKVSSKYGAGRRLYEKKYRRDDMSIPSTYQLLYSVKELWNVGDLSISSYVAWARTILSSKHNKILFSKSATLSSDLSQVIQLRKSS